jgi:hypothetical protein
MCEDTLAQFKLSVNENQRFTPKCLTVAFAKKTGKNSSDE